MMRWWSVKKLSDELRAGRVSKREKLQYFLAASVVSALTMNIAYFTPVSKDSVIWVETAAVILITIFGTLYCFRANEGGDGLEFLDRLFCLAWPLLVKILVAFSGVYLLYVVVVTAMSGENTEEAFARLTYVDTIFVILIEAFYYFRLHTWISRTARAGL